MQSRQFTKYLAYLQRLAAAVESRRQRQTVPMLEIPTTPEVLSVEAVSMILQSWICGIFGVLERRLKMPAGLCVE
jgi:hypothetical protein